MKKRITKILGVVLSLALLSSLAMVTPVIAQPGENEWAEIELDFPLLAPGTDVELLAQAADGTLFASVYDEIGTTWTMYRSEPGADGIAGWEWEETEFSGYGEITAISPAPNWGDNDTVYVAAAGQVYRCTDAADDTPILLRQIVDNTTLAATVVYDMDLWTDGDSIWIMVGTDIDVLVMEDALFAEWIDMDLTISFDGAHTSQDGTVHPMFAEAIACNFAPDFNQSGLIWAIVNANQQATLTRSYEIATGGDGTAEWSTEDPLDGNYSFRMGITEFIDHPTYGYPWMPDWGWIKVYTEPTLLADFTSNPTFFARGVIEAPGSPPGMPGENHGPFISILLDTDGDYTTVEDVLGGAIVESVSSVYDPAEFIEVGSNYYWIDSTYYYPYQTFADAQTILATAHPTVDYTVVGVQIWHGNTWFVDEYQVIDIDDLQVNDVLYNLEPGGNMWISATISPGQWGQVVNSVQVTSSGSGGSGDLEFVDYYSSTSAPVLYAAVDANGSGEGDLYIVEGGLDTDSSAVTPFQVDGGGIDFRSIQVSDQVILGGEADNAMVWISQNGGDTFMEAAKQPTGTMATQVLMAPGAFDPDEGIAYAATSGDESAFNLSVDGGMTWNQTNFVDTEIWTIFDLGFDPMGGSQPGMMITGNQGADSLWVSPDMTGDPATVKWQRTNCTQISNLDYFYLVEYAMDGSVIILYGDDGGAQVLQKSTDNGQTWSTWRTLPVAMGGIHNFVVYDSATIFAACDNGFYGTTRFGPAKQRLAGDLLVSIAIQPGFDMNDPDAMVVIVGNDSGEIFVSDDGGNTWGAAQDVSAIAGDEDIWVAFDALFTDNGLVYFAGTYDDSAVGVAEIDDVDGSAEALEDDQGDDITDVHSTDGFVGLAVSPGAMADGGNALYAICETGWTYRLLLHEDDSLWEWTQDDDLAAPDGLWLTTGSNILWTIDGDAELWALEDTCAGMITGVSVSGVTTGAANVDWNEMTGALEYQVMYDSTSVYDDAPPKALTGLTHNTEYDVLVRVAPGEPWTSRWSDGATFATLEIVATPENYVPENGMQDAPLLPSFVWGSVSAAEYYEFQLSTNPAYDEDGFISGVVAGTPTNIDAPTTAYTQTDELAYDTNHYWIVRAVSTNSVSGQIAYSGWCFSNFHTRMEEIPPVTVEPPPTPTINLPQPTVAVTVVPPDVNVELPPPQVTVVPPDITVDVPAVVTVTQNPVPTIQLPPEEDPGTPVYIWIIVAIGAVLTVAVIVLIIRTRRVV